MKVLWLCNIIPNPIAESLGIDKFVEGGWLTGGLKAFWDVESVEIAVCFPQDLSKELLVGRTKNNSYYGFPVSKLQPGKYDVRLERWIREILEDYCPDIVHIWGTEFTHSLVMAKVFNCPERMICSIQGVCSAIATHYRLGLPMETVYGWTFRDLVRIDNVRIQEKRFAKRANIESQTLKMVEHVIGRTEFDKACVKAVNPAIQYHYGCETLRDIFYESRGSWRYKKCEKYSIFVSSSAYPIKGFHQVLKALPCILERFPDTKVYVAGEDPRQIPFYRVTKYYQYIKKQIKKLQLEDKVIYTGKLDEKAMCERFLESNVFLSASSIENSSNSVGEAMILGMPIVASYVGGTMDLLNDKKEGFLYQSDAPYMLTEYVCRIFEDDKQAEQMGNYAYEHAKRLYDRQQNAEQLRKIYAKVYEVSKG